MCGFLCIFGPGCNQTENFKFKNLSEALNHRGPDDYGVSSGKNYCTYFWRLSIVDREMGKQPMKSYDKSVTLLFNGEIYNYLEIRNQISEDYKFRTVSDTETIIAAYKKWGKECFDHFEGMFSIVIIDHKKNKIVLSRDLAGVKPIYYFFNGKNLFIASEYKVFLKSKIVEKKINRKALKKYIIFQTIPGKSNLVEGINKLMPGEIIEYDLEICKKISESKIEFRDVNFSYDKNDRVVLKSINLNIKGGKMTALVGLSGSGKSTILNLIPRFYNINSGDILIDKQSIYEHKIFSIRKNISLVSQDTTLFDDTIKNNIAYANLEASENDILEAINLSYSNEFINKLPNKIDTMIGENGVRLSGGEKQRISIARAMIKKSSIILLDEATSSLDSETEEKIQNALALLTKNKTTLVIAHRLSTILSSDKIYVIDAGKVVAEGQHKELLENSEKYKNFYDKQLQKV